MAKHPASDKHGALWQAACAQAVRNAHPEKSTHEVDMHPVVQATNSDSANTDLSGLLAENADISNLFMELTLAEHWQDDVAIAKIKERLSSAEPELLWHDSKKIFLEHLQQFSARPLYRDWQDAEQQQDFGVVRHLLADNAKIGIIGDWGTGGGDAKALLEELLTEHRVDVLLHLGDIYFACLEEEMLSNFFNPLQEIFKKTGRQVPVYTIPGNHEYYSSGEAFYQLLDQLNVGFGPDYMQEASYFCLRTENQKWQILGVDSAYREAVQDLKVKDKAHYDYTKYYPGLCDSELQWHKHKLEQFDGRNILLSHHGLLSAKTVLDDNAGSVTPYMCPALFNQFKGLTDKIDLWIWGHEHDFSLFKNYCELPDDVKVKQSCLLGGSARDVEISENLPECYKDIVYIGDDGKPFELGSNNGYMNHSYAVLDLGAESVAYYQIPAWPENNRVELGAGQPKCLCEIPLLAER